MATNDERDFAKAVRSEIVDGDTTLNTKVSDTTDVPDLHAKEEPKSVEAYVSKADYEKMSGDFKEMKENVSQLVEMNNSLIATIQKISTQKPGQEKEETTWQDTYENDPKAAFRQLLQENNKEQEHAARENDMRKTYDSRAYTEFPDLQNPKSGFYKEVAAELNSMEQVDPSARKRIDSIYNASSRVAARWALQGKDIRASRRQNELAGDTLGSAGYASDRGELEPSDYQKRVWKRFGLDPSRVLKQ